MEPTIPPEQLSPTIQPIPHQSPVPQKRQTPLLLIILILVLVSIASYFGYQNWQLKQQISQVQPTATSLITPTATPDPTANWKTINISADPSFGLMEYQIKIPATWEQISHSSNFQNTETFQGNPTTITYQLIIDQEKNLNSQTGKPYSSLREFTGLNYDVSTKTVAGQTAALVQPRAGSETNYMVLFFSPYGKQTVSIELDTPRDGSKIDEGRQLFNQILSTFKFTNLKSEIPNNINIIFTAVNQAFGSKIVPTQESQFYSLAGFVKKESWKLDLSSLLTEKSQFTILYSTLEKILKQDINSTADGVGQSVQGYENDQIYCFLLRGFNASDYLSCVEKIMI